MNQPTASQFLLFFSHAAEFGGAEKSLLNIVLEAQRNGDQVHVVVPCDGPFVQVLRRKRVPVSVVTYFWWCDQQPLGWWQKVVRGLSSFAQVAHFALLKLPRKPDVIISNTLTIPWGMVAAAVLGRPHVHFIREFGTLDFNFDFWLGYERSVGLINRWSSYVFTNSEATYRHFSRYIEQAKLDFLYPQIAPVTQTLFQQQPKYFADQVRLKVAVVGTITPGKGQLDVVKAVARLIEKQPRLSLQVKMAGRVVSEEYYQEILAEINKDQGVAERVKLLGHIDDPLQLIHEADVVVISSQNEAYGRVATEAAALKKAIIATDAGANKDRIEDGVSGLLYPVGSDKALAEKLELVYGNKQLRDKLGLAANTEYTFIVDENMNQKLWRVLGQIRATK